MSKLHIVVGSALCVGLLLSEPVQAGTLDSVKKVAKKGALATVVATLLEKASNSDTAKALDKAIADALGGIPVKGDKAVVVCELTVRGAMQISENAYAALGCAEITNTEFKTVDIKTSVQGDSVEVSDGSLLNLGRVMINGADIGSLDAILNTNFGSVEVSRGSVAEINTLKIGN